MLIGLLEIICCFRGFGLNTVINVVNINAIIDVLMIAYFLESPEKSYVCIVLFCSK